MNRLIPAIAATVFCLAAGISQAQDTNKGPMGGGPHHRMKPCSQETDPAKCEADRKQLHENMRASREACKDNPDRRACMTDQYCSKAQDKTQCLAKAKERQAMYSKRADAHQAAAEACTGKRGDELQKCMQGQREKMRGGTDKK